jgi:hypothetical protein
MLASSAQLQGFQLGFHRFNLRLLTLMVSWSLHRNSLPSCVLKSANMAQHQNQLMELTAGQHADVR